VASVGYMKTEPVIDIVLFSCMFAFIAGIVLAAAHILT
jgi:ABC-type phosphate transport system permease subunit